MKTRIPYFIQASWMIALTTGQEPNGHYRLSAAVRRRLIPVEIVEVGRDLAHCRQRLLDLKRNARKRKITPLETQDLVRRTTREMDKEVRLMRDRRTLLGALVALAPREAKVPVPAA
jgi:hypothetical protein